MNRLTRLLLTAAILVIGNDISRAQNGQKLRQANVTVTNERCFLCDSLASAYLQSGDTSMAIYYFERYLDAHPDAVYQKKQLMRQIRLYNRRQSFYLTDN